MSDGRRAYQVREVADLVRGALADVVEFRDILVEGEISNVRIPSSGHMYFTLKDSAATLACVCFRMQRARLAFEPTNGLVVTARGRIEVYGSGYQLYVERIEPGGIGALALAVEQRRRRLAAEGLFAHERKRPLPLLPRRIAVVTSLTGAAVRDVCTVVRRRAPCVGIVIVPTPVQGDTAASGVIAGIAAAQRLPDVDVVLVVRGGGSFEDLFPFHDEGVARAIAACAVPVVTGIGHESDVVIADDVADRRAATPSAAAEVAVPHVPVLRETLFSQRRHLQQGFLGVVAVKRNGLRRVGERLSRNSPAVALPVKRMALDRSVQLLEQVVMGTVLRSRTALLASRTRLRQQDPGLRLAERRHHLGRYAAQLDGVVQMLTARRRSALAIAKARLGALSPQRTLQRGYSITVNPESGRVLTGVGGVRGGQRLRTIVADGSIESEVTIVEAGGGGK